MKISIIGSNGLLSESIARYCNKNGIKPIIIGRSSPKRYDFKSFHSIDLLTNEIQYEKIYKSDLIIYAAGAGIQSNLNENPDVIYDLNVSIPVKICHKLNSNKFDGVFVSFGSYFEIGENSNNSKFNETQLIHSKSKSLNNYSISKRMFTKFISSVNLNFKSWHFILPTIYGEFESNHRLIPYVIDSIKNKKKLKLTSGVQIRQYIYVDEIAEIIFKSFNKKIDTGVYNIEGSETLTVKELVTNLHKLFKQNLSNEIFGKVNRTDTGMKILLLDGAKLYKTINYTPRIKISDVYDRY